MLDGISFSDRDTLFIVGDIIDRGPDSIPMLQEIMDRKNMICLMGNHELMMLTEYLYPQKESYWLNGSNGGIVTKEAFEQLPYGEQFRILKFISGMYLQYDVVRPPSLFRISTMILFSRRSGILPGVSGSMFPLRNTRGTEGSMSSGMCRSSIYGRTGIRTRLIFWRRITLSTLTSDAPPWAAGTAMMTKRPSAA